MGTLQAIGKVTNHKSGTNSKGFPYQAFRLENLKVFPFPIGCYYGGDKQVNEEDLIFVTAQIRVEEYQEKNYMKLNILDLGILSKEQNSNASKTLSDVERKRQEQRKLESGKVDLTPPKGATALSFEDDDIPF